MKTPVLIIAVTMLMTGWTACSQEKDEPDDALFPSLRIGIVSQTGVIAHRGFWNTKGSAENSLAALSKAAAAGFYGCEFDVRLTLDSVPVIWHDERMYGYVIENTPYQQLRNFRLSNAETLPTLQQYLNLGKTLDIQLILEIKPHSRMDNLKAADIVVAMVNEMGMDKQVEYISLSLHICQEIIRLSPRATVSYLSDISCVDSIAAPARLKALGFSGIDYQDILLKEKPHWITEARSLGMTVNVWTVNDMESMYHFIMQEVDFITTDKPDVLQKMLIYP